MGGRDHSCEVCGRGGFNDPEGKCECPVTDPGDLTERLIRLRDKRLGPSERYDRDTLADAANFIAEAERREGEERTAYTVVKQERDSLRADVQHFTAANGELMIECDVLRAERDRLREALEEILLGAARAALSAPAQSGSLTPAETVVRDEGERCQETDNGANACECSFVPDPIACPLHGDWWDCGDCGASIGPGFLWCPACSPESVGFPVASPSSKGGESK